MNFRFFTIPVHGGEAAQGELNAFCSGHRVLAAERQFVADGANSFWSLCVSYTSADAPGSNLAQTGRRNQIDYREVLDADDFTVYARLRALRKELAAKEGVPAYAIFTNEQLATMARERSNTLEALSAIENVGASRLEKYGARFLDALSHDTTQAASGGTPLTA